MRCVVADRPAAGVVILACGNPSRGDDALGPLLLQRLDDWLVATGRRGNFELIEDFQFQIEHALDLQGRALALFIDAAVDAPPPYRFSELQPDATPGHSSHALPPAAVLAIYPRAVGAGAPPAPPAFVLGVRGERFALGEGLSDAAEAHADAAFALLQSLCSAPGIAEWRAAV